MARQRRSKNTVQNVRVVDPDAGNDSAYIERCIAGLQNSESTITVLCNDTLTLATSNAANGLVAGTITASQVRGTDDFISMMEQFNMYRIRAVRFDIYDINQSVAATNVFSTFHDVVPFGSSYAPPHLLWWLTDLMPRMFLPVWESNLSSGVLKAPMRISSKQGIRLEHLRTLAV